MLQLLKYLKYAQYLQYLPLIAELVRFVREAEGAIKGSGTGASKFEFVEERFLALVREAADAKLISAKVAGAIETSLQSLVEILVKFFNATGGVPPLATEGAESI
jgi:hypothetical protein